jgi:DNA anti-recombination protein RmuC
LTPAADALGLQAMAKNKKSAPQKMTIEKLAQMSQDEFTAIRSEMKQGFESVQEAVKDGLKTVIATLGAEIRTEVQKINYAKEIDELRERVKRLERKVGVEK